MLYTKITFKFAEKLKEFNFTFDKVGIILVRDEDAREVGFRIGGRYHVL